MSKLTTIKFSYYKRDEEGIDSNEWILIRPNNSEYGQAFSCVKLTNNLFIGSTYGTTVIYTVKCTRKEAIKILGSKNFKRAIEITKEFHKNNKLNLDSSIYETF